MIGYVVKDDDGSIWFHKQYPIYLEKYKEYISKSICFELPKECYKKFEHITKPVEVELNIISHD